MSWVRVLQVGNVSRCYDQFLLLFIVEDLPMQGYRLFFTEITLVKSRLMGWALLHLVEQGLERLNALLLLEVFQTLLIRVQCL